MYKHILLGIDGSEIAHRATEAAAMLAVSYHAKLTALYVRPVGYLGAPGVPISEEYVDSETDVYRETRDAIMASAQATCASHNIVFDIVEAFGTAGDALVGTADELQADLIVVGHRGRNAVAIFILGSTAEYVAHNAKCSVMIVR